MMRLARLSTSCLLAYIFIYSHVPTFSATAGTKVILAEATYMMADGDTLIAAEERVLIRAKRKAIEEAGTYIEASSL
ncbi:MAG: hypothetical protein ACT4OO_13055, partial [Nitrospiraceae bacterium]